MPSFFKKFNKTVAKDSSFLNALGGDTSLIFLSLAAYFHEGNPTKQVHLCLKELVRGLYENNATQIHALKKQYRKSIEAVMGLQEKKMEFVINNLLKDLIETSSEQDRIYKLIQWIDLTEYAFKERHYPLMQVWMRSYLFSKGEFWKQDLTALPANYIEKIRQFNQGYPKDQKEFQTAFYIPSPYHPLIEIIATSIEYTLAGNEKDLADTLDVLESLETGYFKHAVLDFDQTIPAPQIEPVEGDILDVQRREQILSLWRIFSTDYTPHFRLSKHSVFEPCRSRDEQKELRRTLEKMKNIIKSSGDKPPLSEVKDKCQFYINSYESKLNDSPGMHRNTV